MNTSLAGNGMTISQIEKQIDALNERMSQGEAIYTAKLPMLVAAQPDRQRDVAELTASLKAMITEHHPAQVHCFFRGMLETDQVVIDYDTNTFNAFTHGARRSAPLEQIQKWWLTAGHMVTPPSIAPV